MNVRGSLMAFTLLVGWVLFGVGRAVAADPGDWEVGNWSGNLRPKSVGCSAMYFNPRDDYSFSLNLYPPGFHSFTITDSSLAYIYFTDDGDDIDEDKGFSGFLNEGSGGINFSVGNNFRTQAKLVQVLISSFELGLPRSVIDAMVPGGPFTVQLPSGKRYTIKLPPSAAAIAHFKKCFGG